jgi:mannose-1-phosphate guanylyltransferase
MAGDCHISGVHFKKQSIIKDGKSSIDPTVVIIGPAYIGDNVKIGAYATIGPNAVIGDDVSIHMGGKVTDSILWSNVEIGIFAKIDGSIAASDSKVERRSERTDTAFTNTESVKWLNSRRKLVLADVLV